jgi:hypothetical protein
VNDLFVNSWKYGWFILLFKIKHCMLFFFLYISELLRRIFMTSLLIGRAVVLKKKSNMCRWCEKFTKYWWPVGIMHARLKIQCTNYFVRVKGERAEWYEVQNYWICIYKKKKSIQCFILNNNINQPYFHELTNRSFTNTWFI